MQHIHFADVRRGGCVPSDFRAWFRVSGPRAAFFLSLGLTASGTASAGPDGADGAHTEIFTGLDATDNSTQGYVGGGYAFGKGMDERGLRFRVLGAFGGYNYESGPGGAPPTQFDGRMSSVLRCSAIKSAAAVRSSSSLPVSRPRTRPSRPMTPTMPCKGRPWV
jgi:hypothetical protein